MATPAPMGLCDECSDQGVHLCTGCRSSRYCSKECQKVSWRTHKHLCKQFRDFQDQYRPAAAHPSQSYSRAILFDPAKAHPEFVWLSSVLTISGYLSSDYSSVKHALADITQSKLKHDTICDTAEWFVRNEMLDRQLDHTVFVRYLDNFLNDGSEFNKAAASVSDKTSRYLHKWCGPILVCGTDRMFRNDEDPVSGRDLAPSDLRHIIDFFNGYLYDAPDPSRLDLREEFRKKRVARKVALHTTNVEAVRINCDGDVKIDQRLRYEACKIPVTHPIFDQAAIDISQRLDLPILVRRIPGNADMWAKREDHSLPSSSWCNQPATFLHIGCQPERENDFPTYAWGLAPMNWQENVGSVVVVRQDKKPLLPGHVAALARFCQFPSRPYSTCSGRNLRAKTMFSEKSPKRNLKYTSTSSRRARPCCLLVRLHLLTPDRQHVWDIELERDNVLNVQYEGGSHLMQFPRFGLVKALECSGHGRSVAARLAHGSYPCTTTLHTH